MSDDRYHTCASQISPWTHLLLAASVRTMRNMLSGPAWGGTPSPAALLTAPYLSAPEAIAARHNAVLGPHPLTSMAPTCGNRGP